eukprot:SAG31_NODE_17445_length_670_cov_0.994746_1_plen_94_part_00
MLAPGEAAAGTQGALDPVALDALLLPPPAGPGPEPEPEPGANDKTDGIPNGNEPVGQLVVAGHDLTSFELTQTQRALLVGLFLPENSMVRMLP